MSAAAPAHHEPLPMRWAGVLALIDHRTPEDLIFRVSAPGEAPGEVPPLHCWPRPLMWRAAGDADDRMQVPEEMSGTITRAWHQRTGSGVVAVLGEGVATGPVAGALRDGHQLFARLSAQGECRPCTVAGTTCLELVNLTVAAVRVFPPDRAEPTGNIARIWAAPEPRPSRTYAHGPSAQDKQTADLIAQMGAEL